MKNKNVRTFAILSIYISIIIILTFVPYTGYLQFGPLAITTIPIIISIATYDLGFIGDYYNKSCIWNWIIFKSNNDFSFTNGWPYAFNSAKILDVIYYLFNI